MERTAFLERVRGQLAAVTEVALPQTFPPTPASGDGTADPQRFLAALANVGGLARVVALADLAEAVANVGRELPGERRAVLTSEVEEEFGAAVEEGLAAAHVTVTRPTTETWRDEAARAALGVTSAAAAVAATGSILLTPGPKAPRVASLLPAAHLAIVPIDRLVPGLEEAMPLIAASAATRSSAVLVTGPSRTSDIEMTTVLGVHGPRMVRVLLVER